MSFDSINCLTSHSNIVGIYDEFWQIFSGMNNPRGEESSNDYRCSHHLEFIFNKSIVTLYD